MTLNTMTNRLAATSLLALFALFLLALTSPALAEGSRSLYPSSATGSRANIEWRTDNYGGLLLRRTLLKVYANSGEYILLGSSALGVSGGSGDALIYAPNRVTGPVGSESLPSSADYTASTAQPGLGKITSRSLELAGPKSVSGGGNASGYTPCYYQAPSTGIYTVVFYGTAGPNSATNGAPTGDVNLAAANNFSTSQGTTVAAWDVTVRASATSTTDLNGRLFANYLALFTGANGLPINATVYAATTDGYQYRVDLRGLDPNGFILYGDQTGFLDSDGATPLYHDVLGADGQISSPQGSVTLTQPSYPIFFSTPDSTALSSDGIPLSPIVPSLSNVSFSGSNGGNNSKFGNGGFFSFSSNLSAVYQIVISRDGTNFDPTNINNRVLRGVRNSGSNTVSWDGKDNSGVSFPIGTNYAYHANIHAGEYHFPLLDAENSTQGGPSFTLLNANNPLGSTTGFYDDRGYRTAGGFNVTSDSTGSASGSASLINQVLGGKSPPTTTSSDPINGFNTTGSQRAYGTTTGGNTNKPNTGSFGDTKGLDLWTYFPSSTAVSSLNIQGAPQMLLVKRITAVNGTDITGFVDDPNTTTDNSAYWPTPAATYLRGAISVPNIKPGDLVDYTIYFVCTNGPATSFLLCDVVPANMTFLATAYNGLTPTDGGNAGADMGIALAYSTSSLPTQPTAYLTNVADSDRGQFYPPGTSAPAAANSASGYSSALPGSSNLNGVVSVTITTGAVTIPGATGAGMPANSYGFIRFRAQVN